MFDYTKRKIRSVEELPTSLRSRQGWAEMFELRRPPEPHVHQIEPTNHCPYTCVMCPRSEKMTRELGFMDMDLYRRIIDEASTFSEPVRSMEIELFHFGESLLHPELPAMCGVVLVLRQRERNTKRRKIPQRRGFAGSCTL